MRSAKLRIPKSGHVCIVDDEPTICQSLACLLSSVGYTVNTYSTGTEFLDHPAPTEPCAALIDFLLPGMTGLTLCRDRRAAAAVPHFVVITGHADVHSAVEAMRSGAIDLVEKPFFSRQRLLEDDERGAANRPGRTSAPSQRG